MSNKKIISFSMATLMMAQCSLSGWAQSASQQQAAIANARIQSLNMKLDNLTNNTQILNMKPAVGKTNLTTDKLQINIPSQSDILKMFNRKETIIKKALEIEKIFTQPEDASSTPQNADDIPATKMTQAEYTKDAMDLIN
jgi:hypothetical protein